MTCFVELFDADTAVIGNYTPDSPQSGIERLKEAIGQAKALGAKRLVGPMNSDTWHRYRLAFPSEHPPFLGEPTNPPEYHTDFERMGFSVCQTYESRILPLTQDPGEITEKHRQKMAEAGLQIRPMDLSRYEEQLKEVFAISCQTFHCNPFYKAISWPAFQALYEPLRQMMDPELSPLVYDREENVVGFGFAYPDLLCPSPKRFVFKSVSVLPSARPHGVGTALFDYMHKIAFDRGFEQVIHALMHTDNKSMGMSEGRYGTQLLREYVLYATNV